jgi:TolB-like protein/class 3 adenylate cyclase
MAKDRLPDKLAVILHADVAGSTELVHQDKQLAHERIRDSFQRFSNTIENYHGQVLELRGDALLASFDRGSDAVAAALAFQVDHTYQNSRLQDDLRPVIRVGISMGEVVIADNTVTGTGVVQAQRVEQLAGPGGICITAVIHDSLSKRLPFEFVSLGERELKGFDHAVHVYRVELASGESVPAPIEAGNQSASPGNRKLIAAIVAVILVVAGGTAYWLTSQQPRVEAASIERMVYPLPDKPSIAVLPFTNMSGVAEQEYFADGMTENLITDLSKISGLFVIARNSSFSYKGQQVKVRQVAEDLGVRYVLEGSVQRAGDRVRINAQLIDATTGGHLWAERYDGSLADIFALQDQITTKIVNAMSVALTPQELEDFGSIGTSNVSAHDAYLQGLSFYLSNTPADNAKAETHFKRAIELDPDFKRAYAALARVYIKSSEPEYSLAIGIYFRKAIFLAYKNLAKSVGANITDAHVVRSQMALYKHQVGVALRETERALDLSTNDVDALKVQARALIYSGQHAQGRKLANRAIRLDPVGLAESLYIIGLSHFASGSYDKAADYVERAIEIDPKTNAYARLLVASYGKLGMEKEAKEALLRFRKLWRHNFWIAVGVFYYPFEDGEVLKHLADGFEAAGTAIRPPSRYLKLDRETRLTGQEIKTLLFGHTIKGLDYSQGTAWDQKRTIDGKVTHSGSSVHTGNPAIKDGESWIENDRLCDRWSDLDDKITICVLIFRDSDRSRNDYYMVTDQGPQPFRVSD